MRDNAFLNHLPETAAQQRVEFVPRCVKGYNIKQSNNEENV